MVLHERGSHCDERGAEDERSKDAVEQDAVLIDRRHPEVVEHEHEHEDVVDGQRPFDDVPGEEFEPGLPAGLGPDVRHGVQIEAVVEHQRQHDPEDRPAKRFAKRDDVCLPVEHAEVEREQQQDERREGGIGPPELGKRKQQHDRHSSEASGR